MAEQLQAKTSRGEGSMARVTHHNISSTEEQPEPGIVGRRELLKALTATGGAVTAAALLPGKWTRPVVEVGLLPAHAQTSALTISNLEIELQIDSSASSILGPSLGASGAIGEFFLYAASFDYNDPLGLVDVNTLVFLIENYSPSGATTSGSAPAGFFTLTGDGFEGTISDVLFGVFYGPLDLFCGPTTECSGDSTNDTSVKATFFIQTSDGRTSNSLSETLPRPVLLSQ
jgi:hypothetical protein